jgi:hypothetical protein
MYYSVLYLQ